MPEPGALHLTRREDLLDLDIEQPDLSIYEKTHNPHITRSNIMDHDKPLPTQRKSSEPTRNTSRSRTSIHARQLRSSPSGCQRSWSHQDTLKPLPMERQLCAKIDPSRGESHGAVPGHKTLEQFRWSWPMLSNRATSRISFASNSSSKGQCNFPRWSGLGQNSFGFGSWLCCVPPGQIRALCHCVDVINTLSVALAANRLKSELKKYLAPSLLISMN